VLQEYALRNAIIAISSYFRQMDARVDLRHNERMERTPDGQFKRLLEIDCTSVHHRRVIAPSKYQERWRKKNADLCPHCTKRKKATSLSRCLECSFEEGSELRSNQPDFVKVMFPSDGPTPSRERSFKKLMSSHVSFPSNL
jgi:hypothetical protein